MKLYLAAIYSSSWYKGGLTYDRLDDVEKKDRDEIKYHLESYHILGNKTKGNRLRDEGKKMFLDSGAYSAMTQGVTIDIDTYCSYIFNNPDIIEQYSVLDVVGDPIKTWENQRHMEKRGLRPLPCYHYGEDTEILDWYVANYDYVTIGGMVPVPNDQLKLWLDRIWHNHLVDKDGRSKVKIHAFGLTLLPMMQRYPWYSVDSSTWVHAARNGRIILPTGSVVSVGHDAPKRKLESQHFTTISETERETLTKLFTDAGYCPTRLATNYASRWSFNCRTYGILNDMINEDKDPKFVDGYEGLF